VRWVGRSRWRFGSILSGIAFLLVTVWRFVARALRLCPGFPCLADLGRPLDQFRCLDSITNTVQNRKDHGAIIPILLVISESQYFPRLPSAIPNHLNDSIVKLFSSFFPFQPFFIRHLKRIKKLFTLLAAMHEENKQWFRVKVGL